MTVANPHSSSQRRAVPAAALVLAGWLVPGSGLFLLGGKHRARGLLFFVLVHVTFLLGIGLHGGMIWPVWGIHEAGFSIFNNITFVFQLGAGWIAILSLKAHFANWTFFAATESHALFDLGSFYCLVAGGVNYFIISQGLDRRKGLSATSPEAGAKAKPKAISGMKPETE